MHINQLGTTQHIDASNTSEQPAGIDGSISNVSNVQNLPASTSGSGAAAIYRADSIESLSSDIVTKDNTALTDLEASDIDAQESDSQDDIVSILDPDLISLNEEIEVEQKTQLRQLAEIREKLLEGINARQSQLYACEWSLEKLATKEKQLSEEESELIEALKERIIEKNLQKQEIQAHLAQLTQQVKYLDKNISDLQRRGSAVSLGHFQAWLNEITISCQAVADFSLETRLNTLKHAIQNIGELHSCVQEKFNLLVQDEADYVQQAHASKQKMAAISITLNKAKDEQKAAQSEVQKVNKEAQKKESLKNVEEVKQVVKEAKEALVQTRKIAKVTNKAAEKAQKLAQLKKEAIEEAADEEAKKAAGETVEESEFLIELTEEEVRKAALEAINAAIEAQKAATELQKTVTKTKQAAVEAKKQAHKKVAAEAEAVAIKASEAALELETAAKEAEAAALATEVAVVEIAEIIDKAKKQADADYEKDAEEKAKKDIKAKKEENAHKEAESKDIARLDAVKARVIKLESEYFTSCHNYEGVKNDLLFTRHQLNNFSKFLKQIDKVKVQLQQQQKIASAKSEVEGIDIPTGLSQDQSMLQDMRVTLSTLIDDLTVKEKIVRQQEYLLNNLALELKALSQKVAENEEDEEQKQQEIEAKNCEIQLAKQKLTKAKQEKSTLEKRKASLKFHLKKLEANLLKEQSQRQHVDSVAMEKLLRASEFVKNTNPKTQNGSVQIARQAYTSNTKQQVEQSWMAVESQTQQIHEHQEKIYQLQSALVASEMLYKSYMDDQGQGKILTHPNVKQAIEQKQSEMLDINQQLVRAEGELDVAKTRLSLLRQSFRKSKKEHKKAKSKEEVAEKEYKLERLRNRKEEIDKIRKPLEHDLAHLSFYDASMSRPNAPFLTSIRLYKERKVKPELNKGIESLEWKDVFLPYKTKEEREIEQNYKQDSVHESIVKPHDEIFLTLDEAAKFGVLPKEEFDAEGLKGKRYGWLLDELKNNDDDEKGENNTSESKTDTLKIKGFTSLTEGDLKAKLPLNRMISSVWQKKIKQAESKKQKAEEKQKTTQEQAETKSNQFVELEKQVQELSEQINNQEEQHERQGADPLEERELNKLKKQLKKLTVKEAVAKDKLTKAEQADIKAKLEAVEAFEKVSLVTAKSVGDKLVLEQVKLEIASNRVTKEEQKIERIQSIVDQENLKLAHMHDLSEIKSTIVQSRQKEKSQLAAERKNLEAEKVNYENALRGHPVNFLVGVSKKNLKAGLLQINKDLEQVKISTAEIDTDLKVKEAESLKLVKAINTNSVLTNKQIEQIDDAKEKMRLGRREVLQKQIDLRRMTVKESSNNEIQALFEAQVAQEIVEALELEFDILDGELQELFIDYEVKHAALELIKQRLTTQNKKLLEAKKSLADALLRVERNQRKIAVEKETKEFEEIQKEVKCSSELVQNVSQKRAKKEQILASIKVDLQVAKKIQRKAQIAAINAESKANEKTVSELLGTAEKTTKQKMAAFGRELLKTTGGAFGVKYREKPLNIVHPQRKYNLKDEQEDSNFGLDAFSQINSTEIIKPDIYFPKKNTGVPNSTFSLPVLTFQAKNKYEQDVSNDNDKRDSLLTDWANSTSSKEEYLKTHGSHIEQKYVNIEANLEEMGKISSQVMVNSYRPSTNTFVDLSVSLKRPLNVFIPGPQDLELVQEYSNSRAEASSDLFICEMTDPNTGVEVIYLIEKHSLDNAKSLDARVPVPYVVCGQRNVIDKIFTDKDGNEASKQLIETHIDSKALRKQQKDTIAAKMVSMSAIGLHSGLHHKITVNIGSPLTLIQADPLKFPIIQAFCEQTGCVPEDLALLETVLSDREVQLAQEYQWRVEFEAEVNVLVNEKRAKEKAEREKAKLERSKQTSKDKQDITLPTQNTQDEEDQSEDLNSSSKKLEVVKEKLIASEFVILRIPQLVTRGVRYRLMGEEEYFSVPKTPPSQRKEIVFELPETAPKALSKDSRAYKRFATQEEQQNLLPMHLREQKVIVFQEEDAAVFGDEINLAEEW